MYVLVLLCHFLVVAHILPLFKILLIIRFACEVYTFYTFHCAIIDFIAIIHDRILWIRSGIEIMWLIEHVANGGQLLT